MSFTLGWLVFMIRSAEQTSVLKVSWDCLVVSHWGCSAEYKCSTLWAFWRWAASPSALWQNKDAGWPSLPEGWIYVTFTRPDRSWCQGTWAIISTCATTITALMSSNLTTRRRFGVTGKGYGGLISAGLAHPQLARHNPLFAQFHATLITSFTNSAYSLCM